MPDAIVIPSDPAFKHAWKHAEIAAIYGQIVAINVDDPDVPLRRIVAEATKAAHYGRLALIARDGEVKS